jgi:hypothetical protein
MDRRGVGRRAARFGDHPHGERSVRERSSAPITRWHVSYSGAITPPISAEPTSADSGVPTLMTSTRFTRGPRPRSPQPDGAARDAAAQSSSSAVICSRAIPTCSFTRRRLSPIRWRPMADGSRRRTPPSPGIVGNLPPDVTYLAFDLTAPALVAGAGWYIVFQELSHEPRFGLASASGTPAATIGDRSELTWDHLGAASIIDLSANPPASPAAPASAPARPSWSGSSADLALILRRRPIRLAIHASDLVQP